MVSQNMGQASVVVGLQWGDEGKGKITDLLAELRGARYIARYQGGNNAGHTLQIDDEKIILHLIPSGILLPDTINVLGNGVVVDVLALKKEMDTLRSKGIQFDERFYISDQAHVTFFWHQLIDVLETKGSLGTTGKGIGQTYSDKINRRGIRFCDIETPDSFTKRFDAQYALAVQALNYYCQTSERIQRLLLEHNVERFFSLESILNRDMILTEYTSLLHGLEGYICDTVLLLNRALADGHNILLEGAQGTFLDIDHGTYPYVTSSNTTAGGACTGTGIAPRHIANVYGILKAYTTRVGEGPFPTELNDEQGERLRKEGAEYGATTGRPRRCGWFDAVLARRSLMINGVTDPVLTKLDVLSYLDEIKVCTSYKINGKRVREFPTNAALLAQAEPQYDEITVPGWKTPIDHCRRFEELPAQAQAYVAALEKAMGHPISIISVGPKREQTIVR